MFEDTCQRVRFGVAGNPPNFWCSPYKAERSNAPEWLSSIGLDALEVQCTYGVRMPSERRMAFKANSARFGIALSVHGPYYIALGTSDPSKQRNTMEELRKSVQLAKDLGSTRVIFHLGAVDGNRSESIKRAIDTLKRFEAEHDLEQVLLYPEIEGKVAKLGSLDEILAICKAVRCARPCLDLAHYHARNNGRLRNKVDFCTMIDMIGDCLGSTAFDSMHMHLYPIEWASRGEIRHRAFQDEIPIPPQLALLDRKSSGDRHYFPRFEPIIDVIIERNLCPTIICEAKDSQDEGALAMKQYYVSITT